MKNSLDLVDRSAMCEKLDKSISTLNTQYMHLAYLFGCRNEEMLPVTGRDGLYIYVVQEGDISPTCLPHLRVGQVFAIQFKDGQLSSFVPVNI